MSIERGTVLSIASKYWQDGNPLEAGKLIFQSLPEEIHPKWAGNILQSVLKRAEIKLPPLDLVIKIANSPNDWGKAHEVFSELRKLTLDLEDLKTRNTQENLLLNLLLLAELVAKVIYNATNPPDEFDEDSGWWIAASLKDILDLLHDEKFSADSWLELCRTDGWQE
jgi:hypothetical protein